MTEGPPAGSGTRRATVLAAAGLLLLSCRRGPDDVPSVPMDLDLRGIPAATVLEIAAGTGGTRTLWTRRARDRAESKVMTIKVEQADWSEVLDRAAREAGVSWDWKQVDGSWIIWVHMPGEPWKGS